jgi:hypothetical protein
LKNLETQFLESRERYREILDTENKKTQAQLHMDVIILQLGKEAMT